MRGETGALLELVATVANSLSSTQLRRFPGHCLSQSKDKGERPAVHGFSVVRFSRLEMIVDVREVLINVP